MTLDQICCSLPLARRLHELKVKQESVFYWRDYMQDGIESELIYAPSSYPMGVITIYKYYSAYTAAELLELLPDKIGEKLWMQFYKVANAYGINYSQPDKASIVDANAANTCAIMLIKLIEQGLIKV